MDKQLDEWNKYFYSLGKKKPIYDNWLQHYNDILKHFKNDIIIDLGCGSGNNSLYLHERGFKKIISCDYSIEAIKRLEFFIENPQTKCFNMESKFPFYDSYAKIVIADLSLHYFSEKNTKSIINEISRILIDKGYLFCRVNSTNDFKYGSGKGIQIEKNYYENKKIKKRFFNFEDINKFFNSWTLIELTEINIERIKGKKAWKILTKNIKKR